MNRNQIILIAIAAFIALYMFSKSGNASTAICEGVYSNQISTDVKILTDG